MCLRELVIVAENDDGEVIEVHTAEENKELWLSFVCPSVIQLYPTSSGSKIQLSVGRH